MLQWQPLGRAAWDKRVISRERRRCPQSAGQARLELFIPPWEGRKVENLNEVWVALKDPVAHLAQGGPGLSSHDWSLSQPS